MKTQIDDHVGVASKLRNQVATLVAMADRLEKCFRGGGKLLVFGNGGSAADAQHIAAELVGRFKHDRKALPAMALTTDSSVLTAVANDLGSEYCFSRQVQALATDRDIVWSLSVSGESANVLNALACARKIGAVCIGFTSRRGQRLCELCDECLMVDHDASDRVQEVHELAYHLICSEVEQRFLG